VPVCGTTKPGGPQLATGTPGIAGAQPPPGPNDAKRRADAARERLKRLRAENGGR